MLALLKQRHFALLWAGQLFSLTGDRELRIALPFDDGKATEGVHWKLRISS